MRWPPSCRVLLRCSVGPARRSAAAPAEPGSGVNWEVTKDTARKTVASLGPDPTPDAGQQRAVTEAVSSSPRSGSDQATSVPAGEYQRRGMEPGGVDRADHAGVAATGGASRRYTLPTRWKAH